jgi:hypothetical protein
MEDEMSRMPWFQFYASDFKTSTESYTNEEVGAYIRLLCSQWDKGSQLIGRQRQVLGAGPDVLGKISKGVLPTPISW